MNETSPPKKLTRSRSDRYIGGVAAGIAERFQIDPIFVRIAFVASLLLGGLGLLAYAVLLATVPVEGDPSQPMPPIEPKRRNQMIGLVVIVGIFCLAIADSGSFAAWVFGFWPGTVFGVLFWCAVGGVAFWALASGSLRRGKSETEVGQQPQPPASKPESAPATTEIVTYAESPSQLSPTEIMETRQLRSQGSSEAPTEVQDADHDPDSAHGRSRSVTFGRVVLWIAVGMTALFVFCTLFVVSAGTTALFGGVPMAALIIALGAGMVFAGLRGRRQLSLWLLTAAIAITLPMAAVSIADLRVEGSYGDINETPLTVSDIPSGGYEMAAGNMTIDLRKFDFERESERYKTNRFDLPVSSGMGLTSVIVPDDVCVTGQVHGKAGVAYVRGRESNGLSVTQAATDLTGPVDPRTGPHTVVLDGQFKLGAFEVVDATQWRRNGRAGSFDESGFTGSNPSDAAARRRAAAACSPSKRTASQTEAKTNRAKAKARR